MNAKQKIVHGRGPSNINLGIFVCSFDVCRVSCMYVYLLNWPLSIGSFQDQYEQTMINKYSNEHNHVKNPNWQEANQLAIYKRSREVELGATENNIS